MGVTSIREALYESALLLDRTKYQALDKIHEISRIFLAQAFILELKHHYRLNYVEIGDGVGVDEKTIRYNWLDANNCPEPENLVKLAKFYLEVKRGETLSKDTLIERIVKTRERLKLSNRKLGKLLGISETLIRHYVSGKRIIPNSRISDLTEKLDELEK